MEKNTLARMNLKTLEALIKDIFNISFNYCSIECPELIRPDREILFTDSQFMNTTALKDLVKNLKETELAVVIDQLFVIWILLRDKQNVYLAGPLLLFSASVPALRGALSDIGLEKDSLSEFSKYQSHIPFIEDNLFKGLVKTLSRLILDFPTPELRWIELYQREPHQMPEEVLRNDYAQSAYEIESEYLEAVYAGNTQKALDALNKIQNRYRHKPATDPNLLISSIYGNAINCTIARIAAFQAGVSPIVLDEMFQEFMIRSVNSRSVEDQLKQAFRMTALVCEQVQKAKTIQYSPMIQKAISYLINNFQKNIRLEQAANLIGVNKNYLSSQFTKETGQTFSQYLMNLRLEQAALRVKMSSEPIGVIAISSGFPDQNYFARIFKKKFGQSPSEYRGKNNH